MDGLGQLYVTQNGSVYALVPAAERELPQRHVRSLSTESEVTQALLTQFLQRQQHQQQGQQLRQQQLALQLEGLPVPNLAHQREEALHNLLQATIMQSFQGQGSMNANVGPSTSSHLGASEQLPVSRRRAPSADSPSDSDSQSPPPSVRGGERSERSNGLGVSTQLSAKEKNRQAQRRFRERQKDLIANLKLRVEDLQTRVSDSEKEVIALKEENAMLRGRIEGKQQISDISAETLQSLLQMTGANGRLAEATKPSTSGAGAGGGGSGGQGARGGGRGGDLGSRGGDGGGRSADPGRRLDFRRSSGELEPV